MILSIYTLTSDTCMYMKACTIVRGCMKGAATVHKSHVQKRNLRVHSCTLGYMRVAKLLRFLLTAVKLIIYKNIFKAQLVVHYKKQTIFHMSSQ